jgi:hypothetical protein
LPGMPAIVSRTVPDDFRSFYQRDFRLFTAKNIRTSFGQNQKIEIDKALTLEHYTDNRVFVSRETEPELLADPSVVRAEPDHVPIIFLRQIPGVEDRHPARSHKDPAWLTQLPRKNRYRPPGR